MSNHSRLLFTVEFTAAVYLIALALGYGWVRAMHYPFTFRQRKMWTYYVLFVSALPVANPLWVALTLWVVPIKESGAIVILLLVVWMFVAFYIVRRMSKPGGRFTKERDRTE